MQDKRGRAENYTTEDSSSAFYKLILSSISLSFCTNLTLLKNHQNNLTEKKVHHKKLSNCMLHMAVHFHYNESSQINLHPTASKAIERRQEKRTQMPFSTFP